MGVAITVIKKGVLQGDLDFAGYKALNIDLTDIISMEFGLQTANRIFAGPSGGDPANPAFRLLVDDDMPTTVLLKSKNLEGLVSVSSARDNLGLTAPATAASTTSGLQLVNIAAPSLEGINFLRSSDNVMGWMTPATLLSTIGAEAALGNPASNGYVLSSTTSGTRSWVSQTAAVLPAVDSTAIVKGSSDATKLLKIEVDGFTTSTTRTLTAPNKNGTIACTDDIPYTAGILFGADEAARSLSLNGNVAFYGEFTLDSFGFTTLLTATGNTSVILPLAGTLATLDGTEDLTNKSYNGLTLGGTGGINLVEAVVEINGTFFTEGAYHLLSSGFTTTLTTSGDTSLTLPTSGTLATRENAETLANKTLEAVAAIGVKNFISGFDINLVNSDTTNSADRNLFIKVNNADRNFNLSGNLVLGGTLTTAGALTQAGAFATTLTSTGATSVTLPRSGIITAWVAAPSTIIDTGTAGQIAYDSGFIYCCIATDSWKRAALSTW